MIKKHVLINALEHKGKAAPKAVLGKVLSENKELKTKIPETLKEIEKIVKEINALSIEDQKKLLEDVYPEYFEKKKVKKIKELPDLPHSENVVTRLPPEPNGYIHIGHGLSFFFNWYYARRYNGRVILRFDDTNPSKEKKEYYDSIKEDLRWLKIDWDTERRESDNIEIYYYYAEEIIKKGKAYICECDGEKIHKDRFEMRECKCRERSIDENLKLFNLLKEGKIKAVLRLKGDMKSQNTSMRDPTLFRINLDPHPIVGKRYKLWPLYDFACAIEDAEVTHVLRDNEFQFRIEVQNYIRDCLNLKQPFIKHYSRFGVKGTPTAKRKIRPLIEENIVKGWDDVRLVTIRGLKRRGILPETIHELGKEIGLSTAEPVIDWSIIESINRKLLDPVTKRYFFVGNPKELLVKNAPEKEIKLKMHPTENLGERTLKVGKKFFIPDVKEKEIRLKDLYNVKILEMGDKIVGKYVDKNLKNIKKLQWVPEEYCNVEILVPDLLFIDDKLKPDSLKTVYGVAEKNIESLCIGEIIQFERFGFCRLDEKNKVYKFIFTHR
ncbi:MAG: glutamate--tRNA ligase [Methanomicrobia archaeon]|nr:glutamate--tRNA ligase [Methanomicrobia archaeon]